MMLMLEVCEQKYEEELPPPSPATEIVMDHGLPCVDHMEKLCDEGVVEKQRSAPFPRETTDEASEALELVHGDICGPISPATPSGNEYPVLLILDFFHNLSWAKNTNITVCICFYNQTCFHNVFLVYQTNACQ
jgi:hypothetical protein